MSVFCLVWCVVYSGDWASYGDIRPVRRFEVPEGVLLTDPHFMDFSPDGRLYVVERNACLVHHWDAEGRYRGSFGRKGQGPGELMRPELVHVTADEVWVFGRDDGRFSVFDHAGTFKRSFFAPAPAVRRFAVLHPDLILVAHQVRDSRPVMVFELINGEGRPVKKLKETINSFFLSEVRGDNMGDFKAYGPEADMYSDKAGTVWFGFSETSVLYRLNSSGDIVEEKTLEIPTARPLDSEKEDVLAMRLSLPGGRVGTLNMMPNVTFHFDHDKAPYTSFIIADGTFTGVLTPIAGNDIVWGYHIGSYHLVDFTTGKTRAVGRYRLPEDSQVLYANGRAVAFLVGEDDDFQITEVALPGR